MESEHLDTDQEAVLVKTSGETVPLGVKVLCAKTFVHESGGLLSVWNKCGTEYQVGTWREENVERIVPRSMLADDEASSNDSKEDST